MRILQVKITAEASKNYQKYGVELISEDLQQGDIDKLKNMAITEAMKGIEQLAGSINRDDIKTETTVMKPLYKKPEAPLPANTYYRKPEQPKQYNGVPGSNTSDNHPASKTQLEMLQRLGYAGDTTSLTSKQAFDIIKQLRGY